MRRHHLPLLMMLILMSSLAGLSHARASEPPCEVCLSRAAVERCATDARQVDATRARLVTCQRALDAEGGATAVLQAQLDALRAMQRAEAERHRAQVERLERRPRWRAVVVVAVTALVVGAVTWEVAR